jgi:Leucine-rich repeat (LRR) protein
MVAQNTAIRLTSPLWKLVRGLLILLSLSFFPAAWSATDCAQVTPISPTECEALLDLYNSTNGINWDRRDGWNETNTPCDWYGVKCENTQVVKLNLSYNNLSGLLPDSLGNLSQLTYLDLSWNQLPGSIPDWLGNLSQLTYLRLESDQLTGPIPDSLSNLNQLSNLDLSGNQLTGPIPNSLGNLNQLTDLDLGGNQLTGTIPNSLGNLSQLTDLDLGGNQLTGTIPNSLGNLSQLTDLDLSTNQLTDPIPESLSKLSQLTDLDLSLNQLTGPIPDWLDKLSQLDYLILGANQLTGQIPNSLGNLSQLSYLYLVSNQLTGPIPDSLSNLSQLNNLSLGYNQLTGTIPDSLSKLSQLSHLGLDGNQLTGPIPDSLGKLSQLYSLSLSSNQLTGPIPDWLDKLSQLRHLSLDSNQLTGPIPDSLGNLNQLIRLEINDNQLCGEIPQTLISLNSIGVCKIANNSLNVNPSSSELINFLNQECPDWTQQNLPTTNCITDKHYTLTLQTTSNGTITAPIGLDDGIQCPSNCSEDYLENTNLTLTAQAADDFVFQQWSGDCTGTDPLLTLTITNNLTCTAIFEPKPTQMETHHFSITPTGNGQGTISLQINHDPAIDCQPDCTDDLPHQSEITLTAQADEFSQFVGWFGDGCTSHFFLTQDTTCTARFDQRPQYALTIVPQGTGSGSINSVDGQIACGSSCSHAYLSGMTITLTATPDFGSSFLGWSGDCHSSTQIATVTTNRHLTCTALFGTAGTSSSSGTPQLQVEPASVTFATTNTLSKRTLTLANSGNASLYLDNLMLADSTAFQLSKDTCSNQWLVPNGTCTVILAFEPPTAAEYQTQLLIASNALNVPTSVTLQGSGCSDTTNYQSNVVFQPYSLNFGTEPVGHLTTLQQRINLWSQGCGAVDIDTITLTGRHAEEFSITQRDCHYGAWQDRNYTSCSLTVAFNPTSAGIKEVQPVITYTAPTLPTLPYRWSAQAVSEGAAQLQLSENKHDFGTITLGQQLPPSWSLILTNRGNVNLEMDQIDITNDFKYYDYGCARLWPQQSCQLTVSVLPTTILGDKSGQLTFNYEGTLTSVPLLVNITGPADCSPNQVTIETTGQSALWTQPTTWQRLNSSTEALPTISDVVRINANQIVVDVPLIQVKALCIEPNAVLVSQDEQGTALAIQASDYFQNLGQVLGLPGQNSTSDTCTQPESIGTTGCAMPGASVIIKVGSQFNQFNKRDDWWWEGDGGPILNVGTIKGGRGGDGRYYAAAGGDTLVLGRNTTNQGLIQAGDGGDLTGTQAGQAGRGGVTQIWGKLGGPGHLYNQEGAQALAGNGGHCQPNITSQVGGHGGNLWLVSLPDVHLSNGIYRAGRGGDNCQTTGDGDVIIEPSIIDISGAKTQISGGNITVFGGPNWILDLRNLTARILDATGDITFATGEGGIIDLRGNHTILIQAQGQVNLFTDTILVDEGVSLNDLIAAKQIVVGPAQLLRNVSLTAPRQVLGQPQSHLALNFILANNGPQAETYTLTLDDPQQWSAPLPSSTLTVAELTSVVVTVPVTLPVTSDVTNSVTLTAISQADPSVTANAQVAITVTTQPPLIDLATLNTFLASQQLPTVSSLLAAEPTVVVDEPPAPANDPAITAAVESIEASVVENNQPIFTANADSPQPTTTNPTSETETNFSETDEVLANFTNHTVMAPNDDSINSLSSVAPTVVTMVEPNVTCPLNTNWIDWPCRNEGQTLQDVTLGSYASVTGGVMAGIINNHGWLSQVEIASGANVTGGYFTGKIRNQGTLTDIQFVGQELSGGTLAGIVNNNSLIGGTLSDIFLAAGSILSGGAVSGYINSDCNNPARLEQVLIKSPSNLSCVILGEGIQLSDNVKFNAIQVVAKPPITLSEPVEILLPALETVALDEVAQPHPTSALVAGGVSVNGQIFQLVTTVTPLDWVTVVAQIGIDPAHRHQPAEIVVYGRYQAAQSTSVGFMLVKDPITGQAQIQPWNGKLAQLVAFESVTAVAEPLWLPIYEDFLKLAAGRLELFWGYRVVNGIEGDWLIQNRQGIDIDIVAD